MVRVVYITVGGPQAVTMEAGELVEFMKRHDVIDVEAVERQRGYGVKLF